MATDLVSAVMLPVAACSVCVCKLVIGENPRQETHKLYMHTMSLYFIGHNLRNEQD